MLNADEIGAIVSANMDKVRRMVERTARQCGQRLSPDDVADLTSDAVTALIDGKMAAWQDGKGAAPVTFMCHCVGNFVRDHFRRAAYSARTYRTTSADESPDILDGEAHRILSPEDYAGILDRLRQIGAGMSPAESADLEAFMSPAYDENAYAAAHGVSITAARARKSRVLAKALALVTG